VTNLNYEEIIKCVFRAAMLFLFHMLYSHVHTKIMFGIKMKESIPILHNMFTCRVSRSNDKFSNHCFARTIPNSLSICKICNPISFARCYLISPEWTKIIRILCRKYTILLVVAHFHLKNPFLRVTRGKLEE